MISPIASHPTVYGKFVMEKETKAENTQMKFINGFPSVQIQYFSKGLIFYKEELILDIEGEILSPRLRDFLSYNQGDICEPLSINQDDPPQWKGKQSPYFCFTDLIIREAADPLSSNRPFPGLHCAVDA